MGAVGLGRELVEDTTVVVAHASCVVSRDERVVNCLGVVVLVLEGFLLLGVLLQLLMLVALVRG